MSHEGESNIEDQASVAVSYPTERKGLRKRILGSLATPSRLNRLANSMTSPRGPHSYKTPYQYSPLSEDRREIRLMTLHEGSFLADIKVSLHTVSLPPDDPPIYEALSYVWGSTENPFSIQVGARGLVVTQNLAEALFYLRYKDRPRILWIDAICVNQQDLKERSLQVKRMADLYWLAERVVVWLGPANYNSGRGMRILEQLSSQIEVDWNTRVMKPASQGKERHWSDVTRMIPYDHKELLTINEILRRPWFARLWVQQEIRLAKTHSIVLCGLDTIRWQSLRTAIFCLGCKNWSPPESSNNVLRSLRSCVSLISDSTVNSGPGSFLEVMRATNHCKYFDARDRVYAILSMLRKSEIPDGIEPDYCKTTSQVYQDVALRDISHKRKIHILKACSLKDTPSDMPSWVPDWTVESMPDPFASRLASGFSYTNVQYQGAGVLSVTGVHLAIVQQSEKMSFIDTYYETVVAELQRIGNNDNLLSSYVGGGSLLAAYCHTFCAGSFAERYSPPHNLWPRSQQSLDFLSAILQPAKQPVPEHEPGSEAFKFLIYTYLYLENRSFIKTREGFIGLAPSNALPGDQVCILLGCDVPILLRPALNHQYRVVGECYVYGLMDGEALLGPLPDHYKFVLAFDQKKSRYLKAFLNHQTGKVQYNDPRLESTPNYDEEYFSELTSEMIEERGVKLRTFDLI